MVILDQAALGVLFCHVGLSLGVFFFLFLFLFEFVDDLLDDSLLLLGCHLGQLDE